MPEQIPLANDGQTPLANSGETVASALQAAYAQSNQIATAQGSPYRRDDTGRWYNATNSEQIATAQIPEEEKQRQLAQVEEVKADAVIKSEETTRNQIIEQSKQTLKAQGVMDNEGNIDLSAASDKHLEAHLIPLGFQPDQLNSIRENQAVKRLLNSYTAGESKDIDLERIAKDVREGRLEEEKIAKALGGEYGLVRQIVEKQKQFEESLKEAPAELQQAYKEGGLKGYNRAVDEYNVKVDQQRRGFESELDVMPENFKRAYQRGGIEEYNREVEREKRSFENKLTELPQELQDAFAGGGISEYNRAVARYNDEIAKNKVRTEVALTALEPYRVGKADKDGNYKYDIEKYIKDGLEKEATPEIRPAYRSMEDKLTDLRQAEQPENQYKILNDRLDTLKDAGFKQPDIDESLYNAKRTALQAYGENMTPWNEAKGETVTLKGAGQMAGEQAVNLVPLTWTKDLNIGKENQMPAWEIGVNAGLDLLILVPVAGWAARGGSKLIVRAGTETIAKSLAKDLPKALIKAGEKELAGESIEIAGKIGKIETSLNDLEKAAQATVKAEKLGNVDKFVKAVREESASKIKFANDFKRIGSDIGTLNAKLEGTAIKAADKATLNRAIGMAGKADDFAEYIADTAKELARYKPTQTLPQKVGGALKGQVSGYKQAVTDIKEFTVASSKGALDISKGAKYLRGEETVAKATKGTSKTATEAFVKGGEKEVQKYLTGIEKQLASDAEKAQTRLAKYGSKTSLDKWDKYIRETWRGNGGYIEPRPVADLGDISPRLGTELKQSGRTMTLTRSGGGVSGATRQATRGISHSYTVPIIGIGGKRIFTVVVNPDTGETTVLPETKTISPIRELPERGGYPRIEPMQPLEPYREASYSAQSQPSEKTQGQTKEQAREAIREAAKVTTVGLTAGLPGESPKPKQGITPAQLPAEELKQREKLKLKEKLRYGEKYAPKMPIIIKPAHNAPENEVRKYLDNVEGFVARRRGSLRGKSVWHINAYPYGPDDKFIVYGNAPSGAKLAVGKGSMQASATLLKGIPPDRPIHEDTGAVDDIITASGNKIVIRSVKDTNVKKAREKKYKEPEIRETELGAGVVETKDGRLVRRHIKL